MLCPLLIFSQSDYLIQIVAISSHTEWQTVQIKIRWLLQKPTDLDLHCLQKQGLSGLSRTRDKNFSISVLYKILFLTFHREIQQYFFFQNVLLIWNPVKRMDTLSREFTLSKLFSLPSERGSTLRGKNLLPRGANSFLLE